MHRNNGIGWSYSKKYFLNSHEGYISGKLGSKSQVIVFLGGLHIFIKIPHYEDLHDFLKLKSQLGTVVYVIECDYM